MGSEMCIRDRLGNDGVIAETEVISTGSLGLDIALGIGGSPPRRVGEIYGPGNSRTAPIAPPGGAVSFTTSPPAQNELR